MKIVTSKVMKQLELEAITNYGINELLLMEQASMRLYEYLKNNNKLNSNISIIVGPGNNGGDGLALARLLHSFTNAKFNVIMLCNDSLLTDSGKHYYNICKNLNLDININLSIKEVFDVLINTDIIIDSIFGTGLSRNIEGKYFDIISLINQLNKEVISVDIPSGIDSDTGQIKGIAIKANTTITFGLAKLGLYIYPGLEYANNVIISKIGLPKELLNNVDSNISIITNKYAKTLLPYRYLRSNKGTYGKVLIIGGSEKMSGAITMTTKSCVNIGAGSVTVAIPKDIFNVVSTNVLESMKISLDSNNGYISEEGYNKLKEVLDIYDVITYGPGLGRNTYNDIFMKELLLLDKPLVIDADGIYALKNNLELLINRDNETIITPHPGEFSYLLDIDIKTLLKDPLYYINEFNSKYNCIVVLKLERTIISNNNDIYINTCGNNGLSKAGSGDVLTGIISGLLAQSKNGYNSAKLGVYLHALTADLLLDKYTVYNISPTLVIDNLHLAINEVRK